MDDILRQVVHLGGLALQSEDCAIRAAVYPRGESGGLARYENERHLQFVIWKALLPYWKTTVEKENNTDLIVECEKVSHFFEMKAWTGSSGNSKLTTIQLDVYKLQRCEHRFVLVTSLNPCGQTDENIKYLIDRVDGLDDTRREDHRFRTVNKSGDSFEFWLAGWPVLAVQPRPPKPNPT